MTHTVSEHVLVVDDDPRVRAALAALIDATPGLHVAATVGSTADAVAIGRAVRATVAVVDVDAGNADEDFSTIRELAEHLAVVAIGDAAPSGIRALEAGASAVCDKDGDPDGLTATVEAAARGRVAPARTTEEAVTPPGTTEVDVVESAHRHDRPTTHRGETMSHLELRARMTVRPGRLEGFTAQASELVRLTRELDTHTLRYDWFISDDGTRCEVHEAYDSEQGLFEHNEHIMAARAVLFRDFADGHHMTAYGDVSQRLVHLAEVHAHGIERYAFLGGLLPEPTI